VSWNFGYLLQAKQYLASSLWPRLLAISYQFNGPLHMEITGGILNGLVIWFSDRVRIARWGEWTLIFFQVFLFDYIPQVTDLLRTYWRWFVWTMLEVNMTSLFFRTFHLQYQVITRLDDILFYCSLVHVIWISSPMEGAALHAMYVWHVVNISSWGEVISIWIQV
jgi:hypothetical protein